MTPILRRQLIILGGALLCGGALIWNSDALWAQDEDPWTGISQVRPRLARDEAAKEFAKFMDSTSTSEEIDAVVFNPNKYGMISRKSEKMLGWKMAVLLTKMVEQWAEPNKIARLESEGDKTAVVVVQEEPTPPGRPIALVEEDGAWGVDLVETYARWNKLEGVEKAKAIYKLTGVELEGLPHDRAYQQTQCQSNLKQITLGLMQYIQDYDERFPPAKTWVDCLEPYVKSRAVFNCPALPKGQRFGYAFNSKLSMKTEDVVSDTGRTAAVYETTVLKNNAYGLGENRAVRHEGKSNFAFADGHVKAYPPTFKPTFKLNP
jgi:prepilin-type processing-associated H-X9-DG protein